MKIDKGFASIIVGALLISELTSCGSVDLQSQKDEELIIESQENETSKEKVSDFYEYVNTEWIEKVHLDTNETKRYYTQDSTELLDNRIRYFFEKTKLLDYDEKDDYYKIVSIYRQLEDNKKRNETGLETLKGYLDRIEQIQNLEELYQLYMDDEMSYFNWIMYWRVQRADYGGYDTFLQPVPLYSNISDEQRIIAKECLANILMEIGYEEKRANEIATNACDVDNMISAFLQDDQKNKTICRISEVTFEQSNIQVPIFEILEHLHLLNEKRGFYASEKYLPFVQLLYHEKNFSKIKDYTLICAMIQMSQFSCDIVRDGVLSSNHAIWGLEYATEQNLNQKILMGYAEDVIANYYTATYVDEETQTQTRQMIADIAGTMRDMIQEADWLSIYGKEMAKRKMNHMNVLIGNNEFGNSLSNVELTDDIVKNGMQLMQNQGSYKKELLENYMDTVIEGASFMQTNAFYEPRYNAIAIGNGYLSDSLCSYQVAYEERLAFIGTIIAHELSHAYDPFGSQYDENGYYNPWMTEEEMSKYTKKMDMIAAFFDGMETSYGNHIQGELIKNEAFADLLAMTCCLNILENKENVDYDLFFKTYARTNAVKTTEAYEKMHIDTDKHLPQNLRVNYTLGQFEQFYETYDIDESSPFYVPEEQRLKLY